MKKFLLILCLFFLPSFVSAALPSDFGEINGETIWLGWTTFESGTVGAKNEGYAAIHQSRQVAYGRYQFHVDYSDITIFLQRMLAIDSQMYGGFQSFVDHATPGKGINPYFSQHKAEFVNLWRTYANLGDERFETTQDEVAYESYYKPTKEALLGLGIDLNQFGPVIKGTIWSVAVRDGMLYPSATSSQTYKALVLTYSDGISDEEYLNRIMEVQAQKHKGAEYARWSSSQKAMAISAMGVEDRATTYKKDNVGGALGGLLEDPYENIFPDLHGLSGSSCNKTFRNSEGELNEAGLFLQDSFTLIKIVTPILVLILTTIDYLKAISSSNADILKKTNQRTMKRIIIGLVIFFLPYLLELLFYLFGLYDISDCGIT